MSKKKPEPRPDELPSGAIRDIWQRCKVLWEGKVYDGFVEPVERKPPYEVTKQRSPGWWRPGLYRQVCLSEYGFRHANEEDIFPQPGVSLAEERRQAAAASKPRSAPPPPPPPMKGAPPPPPALKSKPPPPPR